MPIYCFWQSDLTSPEFKMECFETIVSRQMLADILLIDVKFPILDGRHTPLQSTLVTVFS